MVTERRIDFRSVDYSHTLGEKDSVDDNVESKEVIEDQMVHVVTKDYAELFSELDLVSFTPRKHSLPVALDGS